MRVKGMSLNLVEFCNINPILFLSKKVEEDTRLFAWRTTYIDVWLLLVDAISIRVGDNTWDMN